MKGRSTDSAAHAKTKKKWWRNMCWLGAALFLTGACVMLYPFLCAGLNAGRQARAVSLYEDAAGTLSAVQCAQMLREARAYNARLAGSGLCVQDAFKAAATDADGEKTSAYWSLLDVDGHGVMGYLVIARIGVRLPIYHGTAEETLAQGVGHVQGSSLPVGGADTHAVLSAHTGLPAARFFDALDQLQKGDAFSVYVLGEEYQYRVDQIRVVMPNEVGDLAIAPGKDYVTLVTCTPYGVNTHRLLVRGVRVDA